MRKTHLLLKMPSQPEIDANGCITGEWLGKNFKSNGQELLMPMESDLHLACPYQKGDLYNGLEVLEVHAERMQTFQGTYSDDLQKYADKIGITKAEWEANVLVWIITVKLP